MPFAVGRLDTDGVFYDETGKPFVRAIDRTQGLVAIHVAAMEQAGEDENNAAPRDSSAEKTSEPKLCPDPVDENNSGFSNLATAYQTWITGLPPGLAVKLGNVAYDGCRPTDGTMLDAKANYEQFVGPDGEWKGIFQGCR